MSSYEVVLSNVSKELEEAYRKAKDEIESVRSQYLGKLKSMEVGFNHKLDEIVWMEYFIKYQIDKVKPLEYVNKYFTHLSLQEEFLKTLPDPNIKELNVDRFKPSEYFRFEDRRKFQAS